MPRSLEEVIDEAEELADWFERHGPPPENQRPVSEFFVGCVVDAVSLGDGREIAEAVLAARNAGVSWLQIGEALDISSADAENRFGPAVELAQTAQEETRDPEPEMPALGL
ncbi:MAG: hypothetical protein OXC06_13805 [Acidimicrobiaceae bacterium]|nr:hypothetical protein [Acidimicrobiaceae bacterium]